MDLGLKDKVAFVAGSSRGIGEGIATAFLQEGAYTVITGRDAARLKQTETSLAKTYGADCVISVAGDLSQPEFIKQALEKTIARWGRLDCLVVNVGSGQSVPGWDVSEEAWNTAFEQNLWTSIRIVQAALPHMIAAGKGSIVLITSIAGVSATAAPLAYSSAKAALGHYAANLATLVAGNGIRVNSVAPGNILFPGGSWEKNIANRGAEVDQYIQSHVPQQRFGTVQEIADAVVFLSSDRASFVTGASWIVDGGQTRKL